MTVSVSAVLAGRHLSGSINDVPSMWVIRRISYMNFYVSFVAVSSAALMKFGRWKFLWQNCQSASTDNRLAEVISIMTSHSLDRSVHTRVQPYVMLTSWSALWWPLRPCVVDCRHHRHGDTCRHLRLAGHGGGTPWTEEQQTRRNWQNILPITNAFTKNLDNFLYF